MSTLWYLAAIACWVLFCFAVTGTFFEREMFLGVVLASAALFCAAAALIEYWRRDDGEDP